MFKKLQRHAGEILELPPDVLDKGPRITIMGREEMVIEYCQEVLHFSSNEVILLTDEGKLSIQGKGFILTAVLETEITIRGRISQVRFEEA